VSELLPLGLILASLAGTLALVVAMHRRPPAGRPSDRAPAPTPVVVDEPPVPPPPQVVEVPTVLPEPVPAPPSPPAPPPEDPTKKELARIAAEEAAQRRSATEADRRADALEAARGAAVAESQRWRRRETLVRAQIDGLTEKAERLEREADEYALERDALARERDAAKAELVKARARGGGYAVMPHKGPNGTWQRPVVIECLNGQAVLQPHNLRFTMLDLSPLLSARASPFVVAVARELIRIEQATSPDGAPIVPYIYFIVRPDGIRPYYEARARLEPLGIAFGYELVEQDWQIDFPDLDTWDDSGPATPKHPAAGSGSAPGEFTWPADRPGTGRPGDSRDPLLWPTRPAGAQAADAGPGGPDGAGREHRGTVPGRGQQGPARFGQGLSGSYDGALDDGGPDAGSGREGGGPGPGGGDGSPLVPFARPGGAARPGFAAGGGTGGSTDSRGLAQNGPSTPGWAAGGSGRLPRSTPFGSSTPGGSPWPGAGGAATSSPGGAEPGGSSALSPVHPNGLPGFEKAEDRPGQDGVLTLPSLSTPATGAPGAPGTGFGSDDRGPGGSKPAAGGGSGFGGLPYEKGDSGGSNSPPAPGTNRVTIDPATLEEDDEFENRPPAQPRRLRFSGTGAASTTPEGFSLGGVGQSSASGGGQGQVGVGLPVSTGSPPSDVPSGSGQPTPSGTPSPSGLPSFAGLQNSPGQADRRPVRKREERKTPRGPKEVNIPLELVVACGPDGVVLHPGGYRISRSSLQRDRLLLRDLETIVRNHELIDPSIHPRPRVRFLVERGGSETYWEARRQTDLAGLSWPVSVQVAESSAPRVMPKERF
jgi:hypothetical protein